jgi:hypothetical protein
MREREKYMNQNNELLENTENGGMTVLVVEPMKVPYTKTLDGELSSLQNEVGGDIEATYPFEDMVGIVLNENGKFSGLPLNRALYDEDGKMYDIIAGTFLVVGLTEDDFGSLTADQIDKFRERFRKPEMFLNLNGEIVAVPMKADGRAMDVSQSGKAQTAAGKREKKGRTEDVR